MDKIFADGLMFKGPREGAPEFVKGSLSVKVEDFKAFLDAHVNNAGWVNIDIKESRGGELYCELNTYKPEAPAVVQEDASVAAIVYPQEDINPDDIPF